MHCSAAVEIVQGIRSLLLYSVLLTRGHLDLVVPYSRALASRKIGIEYKVYTCTVLLYVSMYLVLVRGTNTMYEVRGTIQHAEINRL